MLGILVGARLMAGRLTLDQLVAVQIRCPQQQFIGSFCQKAPKPGDKKEPLDAEALFTTATYS